MPLHRSAPTCRQPPRRPLGRGVCSLRVWLGALALSAVLPALAAPDLATLRRTQRGQPEAALVALEPLLASAQGAELVEALVFQGEMCNRLPDDACLERSAVRLDTLAQAGTLSAAAMAAVLRAMPMVRRGPFGRADRQLAEAADQLPASASDSLRMTLLTQRLRAKRALDRVDEALALSQQAVLVADHGAEAWQRAESRVQLAYALGRARQTQQALKAAQAAQDIARGAGDLLAEAQADLARAQLMTDLGREDEDLAATREAIRLAREAGDKRMAVLGLANLSDHYLQIHDYATALTVASEALPLAREVNNTDGESVALANSGVAMIPLGRHKEGMARVREALAIAERAGDMSFMADIQHDLGDALEHAGRLGEAWTAYRDYRRLADESFHRDQQQAVLELEESFDAELRRNALAMLRTETTFKEAQLVRHDLRMRFWAIVATLGVLLLLVVLELLRRVRRSNRQLQSTNDRLQQASESDPLTGLANRRHFRALMQQLADAGTRFSGALILIDLDHFKSINDDHGHAAGDAVLVEVSRRLRQILREPDLAVRWGGEEFLLVLRTLPAARIHALAERLLEVIGSEPVRAGRLDIAVTASIGFASFPFDGEEHALGWERAIDLVDQAMYCAKAQGRNRACGVVSMSAAATLPGAGGPEALLGAWRGGDVELSQVVGPVQREAKA